MPIICFVIATGDGSFDHCMVEAKLDASLAMIWIAKRNKCPLQH